MLAHLQTLIAGNGIYVLIAAFLIGAVGWKEGRVLRGLDRELSARDRERRNHG